MTTESTPTVSFDTYWNVLRQGHDRGFIIFNVDETINIVGLQHGLLTLISMRDSPLGPVAVLHEESTIWVGAEYTLMLLQFNGQRRYRYVRLARPFPAHSNVEQRKLSSSLNIQQLKAMHDAEIS